MGAITPNCSFELCETRIPILFVALKILCTSWLTPSQRIGHQSAFVVTYYGNNTGCIRFAVRLHKEMLIVATVGLDIDGTHRYKIARTYGCRTEVTGQ